MVFNILLTASFTVDPYNPLIINIITNLINEYDKDIFNT